MRKGFVVAAVAVLGLVGGTAVARGDRDLGETEFIKKLNGSPVLVATVSTDGGVSQNSCTSPAGFFDAGYGNILIVQCTTEHYVAPGACTAAFSATSADSKVLADEKFYMLLRNDQNAFASLPVDGGIIGTCRGRNPR